MSDELDAIFGNQNNFAQGAVIAPVADPTPQPDPIVQADTVNPTPTPDPTPTTTTTTPDIKGWVKEKFGIEDENEVVERFKKYDEISLQAQEATKRLQELETQNKALAERPTYKSDFAKKADEIYELTKGNVSKETIARFYDMKPSELKAEDALDLVTQIDYPTLSVEERNLIREEKYGMSDELMLTPGQKAVRKAQFEQDATIARERLQKLAAEAFKPTQTGNNQPSQEEIQAEQDRVNYWQQNANKIDNSIFKKELPSKLKVPNGKGGVDEIDNNFTFTLPEESKAKILNTVAQEITKPENARYFTSDAAGIERANAYLQSVAKNAMFEEALKAQKQHFEQSIATVHETYAKLLNNTNFLTPKTNPTVGLAGEVDYNKSTEEYLSRFS
jgi:hypothetical protein